MAILGFEGGEKVFRSFSCQTHVHRIRVQFNLFAPLNLAVCPEMDRRKNLWILPSRKNSLSCEIGKVHHAGRAVGESDVDAVVWKCLDRNRSNHKLASMYPVFHYSSIENYIANKSQASG